MPYICHINYSNRHETDSTVTDNDAGTEQYGSDGKATGPEGGNPQALCSYAAAKAYIEQQQQVEDGGDIYPVTQCFTAQVKQNLPATGYHYEDVKMYYREELKEEGQIYPDLFLDFATKRYNFAAREYYEEYLYDQQGHFEFIYAAQPDLSEGKDYELRFYFHNGELIEVIIKSRQMGGGTFATIYQGNTVPAAYSDSYKSRLGTAKGIMALFKTINANREL